MTVEPTAAGGIAVVGIAARLPGAPDLDSYWRNLVNGVCSVTRLQDEDLKASGVSLRQIADPNYVKAYGVLEKAGHFDADFFGFTPREAELLDPQQRIFLETAWTAMEHAGYGRLDLSFPVGVYAGSSMSTYFLNYIYPRFGAMSPAQQFQAKVGNDKDFLPNRAAYKLNLRGPAVAVQTGCSTSLTAVALACESLLGFQCDMALAGGASVSMPQHRGAVFEEGNIASRYGTTRAFDAEAGGTLGGNGAGVVVLKRLEDAVEDGDTVYAVIRGAAINNDGLDKLGYTAPGPTGQAECIHAALNMAEVEADGIDFVEAHGTATKLGDPVEVQALTTAYRTHTDRCGYCALGSVKTNFGHLDAAAGIAGLIKAVLALHYRLLPPSLNFQHPNPNIDFEDSPFYVADRLIELSGPRPLRAGVSAFGIGGSNAHVVLEEAPVAQRQTTTHDLAFVPVLLSARTPAALERAIEQMNTHLNERPSIHLTDAAYTLYSGRSENMHRALLLYGREAREPLTIRRGNTRGETKRPVVFMFSGNGGQYVNMGLELYRESSVFTECIDHCAHLLRSFLGKDIRNILYPHSASDPSAVTDFEDLIVSQCALFTVEYALATHWLAMGVRPDIVTGHSLGEYAAACIAGMLLLEDAILLVYTRARLMSNMPRGAMLSVAVPVAQLEPQLGGRLSVAVINTPKQTIVAGPQEDIEELECRLVEQGLDCRRVRIQGASHCHLVDDVLDSFQQVLDRVAVALPQIPYVSCTTARFVTPEEPAGSDYWCRHFRETVRFDKTVDALLEQPETIFVEIGPGHNLEKAMRQNSRAGAAAAVITSLPHHNEPQPADAFFMESLGRFWIEGGQVDWSLLFRESPRRRVPLPTYPFERREYLLPLADAGDFVGDPFLKQPDMGDWFYIPSWTKLPPAVSPSDREAYWLVLSDGCCDGLVENLRKRSAQVVSVRFGDVFSLEGEQATVVPGSLEDMRRLLDSLECAPDAVVYAVGDGSASDVLTYCYEGVVSLACALAERTLTPRLLLLADRVMQVHDEDPLSPEKAVILGLAKVIPTETGIPCQVIDPGRFDAVDWGAYVDPLLPPLNPESEPEIALRGRSRWARRFKPVVLPSPGEAFSEGTVLVTGGLGGIGFLIAGFLQARVGTRLALLSRKPFPPPTDWEDRLASHPEDVFSEQIKALQAWRRSGGVVEVYRADITDETAMRAAVDRIRAQLGPIHTVIHAAGETGDGVLELKTKESIRAALAPKVTGTRVLERVLADHPPRLTILFSSLAAIKGGFGLADYCAANTFLDAYAESRTAAGFPTLAIAWDAWHDVGMAKRTAAAFSAHNPDAFALEDNTAADYRMSAAEGLHAFARILAGPPLARVLVCINNLKARIEQAATHNLNFMVDVGRAASAMEGSHHSRPHLSQAYVPPETLGQRRMAAVWRDLFGLEALGIHDDFFELGGDSLLAIQFVSRAKKAGIAVRLQDLFAQRTIAALSASHGETPAALIVPLKPEGGDIPLFLAPPITGTALCYRTLAKEITAETAVFGLQVPGLELDSKAADSIEALAGIFIENIREVQPKGPYILGGWSMGGALCFEMALQLREQGESVARVILIDAPVPLQRAVTTTFERLVNFARTTAYFYAGHDLDVDLNGLEAADFNTQWRHLIIDTGLAQTVEAGTPLEHFFEVFRHHGEIFSQYRPRRYDGEVVLLRAERPEKIPEQLISPEKRAAIRDASEHPALGWEAFCRPQVVKIAADHQSIVLDRATASHTAAIINRTLLGPMVGSPPSAVS